jgi:hypothetical protein
LTQRAASSSEERPGRPKIPISVTPYATIRRASTEEQVDLVFLQKLAKAATIFEECLFGNAAGGLQRLETGCAGRVHIEKVAEQHRDLSANQSW